MTPLVTLAAIVLAPVIVLMVLRVNAVLVFLSLCLGDVLVQFIAGDTNSLLSFIASSNAQTINSASGSTLSKLILLLLPVVLTTLFMLRSVHGMPRLLLNTLPALGVGLLGALLLVPLLPGGLQHNIMTSALWDQVHRAQDLIVGTSALICLLVLWQQRAKHQLDKHGKH